MYSGERQPLVTENVTPSSPVRRGCRIPRRTSQRGEEFRPWRVQSRDEQRGACSLPAVAAVRGADRHVGGGDQRLLRLGRFFGQADVGVDHHHHREANGGVDLVRIIDRQLISQRLRELVVGLDPQGFVVPTFAVFRARDDDVPGVLIALEGEGTLRLLRPFLQQLDEQLLQLLVAEVEGALLVVEKLAIDPLRLVLLCHRRGRADRAGQQPQTEPGHAECSDDPLPIVQLNHCRPPDPVGQSRSHPWPPASNLGSVVLPARMGFSICRRYALARSIARMRVLIVEDEPYMAEAIRDGLRLEAIAADIAGDGDTALELLSSNAYAITVLDRDIPGPSGDEIAKRIVDSGSGMPILMLTAADRLDDKASGFELGADDYLTKPFALQELVLRLRALDRRRAHNRPPVREIAGLRLDPFRREVYRDGRYVALTRKQFAVLEVLVAAEGGVISAEELLERAWDENADPFTNAVRITVSALRKRLGEPGIIATVAGVGYRIDTAPRTEREGGDRG